MPRGGLRIRGARGQTEVKDALIQYAKWLRQEYEFPIRVPVYLFPGKTIVTRDGDHVAASFFAPYDREEEPLIRIATGDFPELEQTEGRDGALAAFIMSMSHEIVHYFQWIETGQVSERGVARKAEKILRRYAQAVDRP